MGQDWTFRLLSEIHKEVRVKGQTARVCVHIQTHQEGALAVTHRWHCVSTVQECPEVGQLCRSNWQVAVAQRLELMLIQRLHAH